MATKLSGRQSLCIEDTELSKTWVLWWIGKAEFSCWLGIIFSSENSYEELTLKPVDSYNLRKHQRLFLWGVAPRTWLKFGLFQMCWKLQKKWESICQSVMGFLLTTLIRIKDNEVDFCFSNSPLGKLPKILLLIIYSCNLANVQRGGKGFYLAH